MSTTHRINGFVRLAALVALGAVPVLVAASALSGQPGTDPAETIRKMEEQRKKENPTPPAPEETPPAPRAPAGTGEAVVETGTTGTRLLRENTFITQRRGRMSRSQASEWVFTMDTDGKGRSEPAMVLMPCMNLQNMEKTVDRAGEGTSFTVSGTVYVYKGRNYLLPSMFVVNRRSDLAPPQ